MRLRYLFMFLTIITIVLTVLYLLGYGILDLIMAMITVEFLSLGAIIEHRRKFPSKTIRKLSERVDKIEKVCDKIYNSVSNPGFERLQKLNRAVESSLELEKNISFGPISANSRDKIKTKELNSKEEEHDSYAG